MDNEELLKDFFRALRVTLTNAFSYSKDHPYFLKSVEELKSKLDQVIKSINPFTIGVTDAALVADGKTWQQQGLHDELARIMHQRKIKNIKISPGFDTDELIQFLFAISLPTKDILKSGGVSKVLLLKGLRHFEVEELDYSSFLDKKGQEDVDIWEYLLKEILNNEDRLKLEEMVNNFPAVLAKIREEDFFSSAGLAQTLKNFLAYLKSRDMRKFNKCARDIFMWLLQNKRLLDEEKLNKVKEIFGNLSNDDFQALLWEGLLNEEQFDDFSLQLFAKISDKNRQKEFADNLLKMISSSGVLKTNPKVVKKIQALLTRPAEDSVSAVYRNTLNYLSKEMLFFGVMLFDRAKLKANFRYILLSLLAYDAGKERSNFIVGIIDKELGPAMRERDLAYLQDLWGFFLDKQRNFPDLFSVQENKISAFMEDLLWKGELPEEFKDLSDRIKVPAQEPGFYLERMFAEHVCGPVILRWFLRMFNNDLRAFYSRLDGLRQNTDLLAKMIADLSVSGSYFASQVLEYIYNFANPLIQMEVLKGMHSLPSPNYQFLCSILNTDSVDIRKEALSILAASPQAKIQGIDALFNTPWSLGKRKRITLENMHIVWELGLKDASGQLLRLSKKMFFWNSQVRNNAAQILRGWNAG
ncbi:MAG: hypothetical protein WC561_01255 [Candidatus Omnitrophota bacterium]